MALSRIESGSALRATYISLLNSNLTHLLIILKIPMEPLISQSCSGWVGSHTTIRQLG